MKRGLIVLVFLLTVTGLLNACAPQQVEPKSAVSAPTDTPVPAPTNPAAVAQSPFTGNPAWIAYQTNRSGSEGVWLIHPDGTEDHQIVTGELTVLLPDWSPDGKRPVVASRGGDGEYPLHLVPFLQVDTGDLEPTAHIAEIHPQTAREMGVKAGDTVLITSPFGELEALLRETPQVATGTLALPIDLNPKSISDDRDTIPLGLFGALENGSGDLAFMATSVKLKKVGNMPTLLS